MPPRRRDAHSLGELEAAVLEALWDHGELSTPAVYEHLDQGDLDAERDFFT